jgi:hypothetical protein
MGLFGKEEGYEFNEKTPWRLRICVCGLLEFELVSYYIIFSKVESSDFITSK